MSEICSSLHVTIRHCDSFFLTLLFTLCIISKSTFAQVMHIFFCMCNYAQIPNPLFDLAGITCGHFLVPFWTFFGATVIGKAVIKMHIQVVIDFITALDLLVRVFFYIFIDWLVCQFFFHSSRAPEQRRTCIIYLCEGSFEFAVVCLFSRFVCEHNYSNLQYHHDGSKKICHADGYSPYLWLGTT